MKLKNILFATLAISTLSMGIVSCSDSFLDEKMYSKYTPERSSSENLITGLYYTFAYRWGRADRQGYLSCFQIGTDVASAGDVEGVETPFYQYQQLTSESSGVSMTWEMCYEFINQANLIIAKEGENGNKVLIAEAKFFRAYAYNMLVTLWGDVPLVTEPSEIPRLDYTREEVAKIDKVIDDDLQYAITNLPDMGKTASEDRANKDFARQLGGEAYLRMGMRDVSYWEKAEKAVTPIIENTAYQLIQKRYGAYMEAPGDYYHDMFRWHNQRRSEGNTEAIWTFEMEYNRDVLGGTIENPQHRRTWVPAFHKYSGMQNADSIGGRGSGRLRLSNFMKYGLYEEGDIRNSNYNIRRVMWYNKQGYEEEIGLDKNGFRVLVDAPTAVTKRIVRTGDQVIPGPSDSLNVFYPHTAKWGCYDETDDFGYAGVKDWPVMRLGETYLLRAEARFRQNKLAEAANDINVLRDRAFQNYRQQTGNPNAGKVSANDITLDFILDERARELIGEENRRMTLVRTNTLAEHIQKNGDAPVKGKSITGFDAKKNCLLPIPLSVIQLNKDAKIEQNPGY